MRATDALVSSRATEVRTAQQLGSLAVLPYGALYVAIEIGAVSLDASNLALIAGALVVLDALLFWLARRTFRREEILTRWR